MVCNLLDGERSPNNHFTFHVDKQNYCLPQDLFQSNNILYNDLHPPTSQDHRFIWSNPGFLTIFRCIWSDFYTIENNFAENFGINASFEIFKVVGLYLLPCPIRRCWQGIMALPNR